MVAQKPTLPIRIEISSLSGHGRAFAHRPAGCGLIAGRRSGTQLKGPPYRHQKRFPGTETLTYAAEILKTLSAAWC